jgi:hypothetical protein
MKFDGWVTGIFVMQVVVILLLGWQTVNVYSAIADAKQQRVVFCLEIKKALPAIDCSTVAVVGL